MNITHVKTADLIPYARNARTHMAVRRWQELTRKQATLEATGEPFEADPKR